MLYAYLYIASGGVRVSVLNGATPWKQEQQTLEQRLIALAVSSRSVIQRYMYMHNVMLQKHAQAADLEDKEAIVVKINAFAFQ